MDIAVNVDDTEPTRKKPRLSGLTLAPEPPPTLTVEQEAIVHHVMTNRDSIFITGDAGTGKSTVLMHILDNTLPDYSTGVTAMTGIAALLISGRTLHSFAGLGLGKDTAKHIADNMGKGARERLCTVRDLVIDEVSMIHADLFDLLDGVMRRVRRSTVSFGGVRLILVGDLLQLPPVVKEGIDPPLKFIFESEAWKRIKPVVFDLRYSHRQADQADFAAMLAEIRQGICSEATEKALRACIGRHHAPDHPAIHIYPHNAQADRENERKLGQLVTEQHEFKAMDWRDDPNDDNATKQLAQLRAIPLIRLKVGAQVMYLRNYGDMIPSLVNGSVGTVTAFQPKEEGSWPVVDFGDDVGLIVVRAHQFEIKYKRMLQATRLQVPLMLCWAISGHKSQGQTITANVVADMGSVFAEGQAYVMLSRVKRIEQLSLLSFRASAIMAHPRVVAFYKALHEKEVEEEKRDE